MQYGALRLELPGWLERQPVHDPALAGWLYGREWVAAQDRRAATFTLWRPASESVRAWCISLTAERSPTILESAPAEPSAVWRVLEGAEPLEVKTLRPERLEVTVEAVDRAAVIVSQLADPQWQARWVGNGGAKPAVIVPVFAGRGEHGWQAVELPGPGRWTLHLEYVASDVRIGLMASGLSWLAAVLIFIGSGRGTSREGGRA
jgi:hypothetical protein